MSTIMGWIPQHLYTTVIRLLSQKLFLCSRKICGDRVDDNRLGSNWPANELLISVALSFTLGVLYVYHT